MSKQNINHHAGRYVRPRVRLISLENAAHLLLGSGGGDTPTSSGGDQVNFAQGTVLGSLGGTKVSGGSFGYGGGSSGDDYGE